MPYITKEKKLRIHQGGAITTPGELNYAITSLLNTYIKDAGGLSYSVINDILGACTGAQMEFYHRVAVPYEGQKLIENGDVYDVQTVPDNTYHK